MGKGPHVPQSSVDASVNLQNTEAGLLQQYAGIAVPAAHQVESYWQGMLAGGPAAQAATAPFAQTIAQQTAQNQKNIQNTLPAGGEKNLALAQNQTQQGASIANLYQGLGPTAATQLQNLALGTAGAGTGSGAVSSSTGASLGNLAASQAAAKGNMFGGIGQGIGSLAGGALGSKGTGAGALGGKAAGGGSKAAKTATDALAFA
jgi:hypothetical protein